MTHIVEGKLLAYARRCGIPARSAHDPDPSVKPWDGHNEDVLFSADERVPLSMTPPTCGPWYGNWFIVGCWLAVIAGAIIGFATL